MATVLITGANRGIGLELARQYAKAGDTVIRTVRGDAPSDGVPGMVMRTDVTDDASVAGLAASLQDSGQPIPIDLLINNAGVIGPEAQGSTTMDFDGFRAALDANTLGPLRVTQALLPNLRAAGGAKVAVVSSRMGSFASAGSGHVAYRATKAAVNRVFQCLAADLAGEGMSVAILHPGWVRTDMGGPGADLSVEESASGIRSVLAGLDVASSGRFTAYDGSNIPW